MATAIFQPYDYYESEKYPNIQYTQLRNLGTRLPYDKMAQNFSSVDACAVAVLTPTTVLGHRCGYMFAMHALVTLQSISVDKQAIINFNYENGLLGATIKGRGCAEEVRYVCQSDTHTFFVVKFGQGTCCLQLGWRETEPTVVSTKSMPGAIITARCVPSYTNSIVASYPQESVVDSGLNSEPMQYEANNPLPEKAQELKECTNVLVLVSWRNQRLWNTIYNAMKEKQVIKAEENRIIVRWMLNPFNTIVVMALAYEMENAEEVRVAVPCADNIIFFGDSSLPHSYVLSSVAYRNTIFDFDKLFADCPWTKLPMDINNICDGSGSILDLIRVHRKGQVYALMTLDSDDYTLVPNMIYKITLRCKSTPITPELYTCWKFTGLVGQTEEEYRHQVSEFIQHYGIPAVIDAVCRGCIAVVMHGPRWLWWYLTTFKNEISTTFGPDLRSITQIGVNNVIELMKRKDNTRFQQSLSRLRTQMIYNVPERIPDKLSIIFESGAKELTLSCTHQANKSPDKHSLTQPDLPVSDTLNLHLIDGTFKNELNDSDNPSIVDIVDKVEGSLDQLSITNVHPTFESTQTEITHKMRGILEDWLDEVAVEYSLQPQTLFLSKNYLNRYLTLRHVSRKSLQLVGITCMFIAAKYEEIAPPSVNDFVWVTANTYTREEMISCERDILTALEFKLTVATPECETSDDNSTPAELDELPITLNEPYKQEGQASSSLIIQSNQRMFHQQYLPAEKVKTLEQEPTKVPLPRQQSSSSGSSRTRLARIQSRVIHTRVSDTNDMSCGNNTNRQ